MEASTGFRMDSTTHELKCARQIVGILFEKTGLSTIVCNPPIVIVGDGNWISFTVAQAVSREVIFRLKASNGKPAFVSGIFNRPGKEARSTTSPSLHLTNLDSGENLRGHVDAHYWATNSLGHADEFLTKKTAAPSDLLKRLQNH